MFSIVNLARFLRIDSEEALNLTNQKFINRFEFMEQSASKLHIKLEDLTLDQMEELWQKAKENKLYKTKRKFVKNLEFIVIKL